MKKQLLLVMAFAAGMFSVNAQGSYIIATTDVITSATVIESVPGVKLSFGTDMYVIKPNEQTFNDVAYTAYVSGTNNVKLEEGTGSFYKFDITQSGKLDVIYVLNASKPFYVLENGISLTDNVVEGYPYTATTKVYEGRTIDVKAGNTYYVFCTGSKLGFYGFNFVTAGVGVSSTELNKEVVATNYYNAVGVQQKELSTGLNIIKKTMNDGSVVVEKSYIK